LRQDIFHIEQLVFKYRQN